MNFKIGLACGLKAQGVSCTCKWVLIDFSLIAVESMTSRNYCLSHEEGIVYLNVEPVVMDSAISKHISSYSVVG